MINFDVDTIIIGAGISGSFIAHELALKNQTCLVLEAGKSFQDREYPSNELDANSQLYWSGGVEFNTDATIGFLRPKVVGGGSVVNQALVDRFDDIALDSWKEVSQIGWMTRSDLDPWYDKAESMISIQTIPAEFRNGNAKIFEEGFKKNGFRCAPLRRAQRDCRYEDGNDCIECLAGCKIRSKQSVSDTVLKRAQETGRCKLVSEFEVTSIRENADGVEVVGIDRARVQRTFLAKKAVLASGAIGNSKLLIRSQLPFASRAVGQGFYTHPQYMNLAIYDHQVNSHKGPFQAFKSDDPNFRKSGFKLENVFAPPVSISMLLPGVGRRHQEYMKNITRFACVEVAVRDTNPGQITVAKNGKVIIQKRLNSEDEKRRDAGLDAVMKIFDSTGAREIIKGGLGIGLHLMGGCAIGKDSTRAVVDSDFKLHGSKRLFAADSSIFPNAPGINPSLSIMALSLKAAESISS